MKAYTAILAILVLPCIAYGFIPPPMWQRVEGKGIGFFKDKGFGFCISDAMSHNYEKPTVEISIVIPDRFTDTGRKNRFSGVLLLNNELGADLASHRYSGKNRIILTISQTLAQKSQAVFYFKGRTKYATDGWMYVLDLSQVLDDWKRGQHRPATKAVPPDF